MSHEAESLIDAEQRATAEVTPQIRGNLDLCLATFDLIGMALTAVPPRPVRELTPAFKVTTDLLMRLANDLRSVGLLAERGYALQAASLAASIYEVAHTVAFIGADDGLAQEWIRHEDPTRPFAAYGTSPSAFFKSSGWMMRYDGAHSTASIGSCALPSMPTRFSK